MTPNTLGDTPQQTPPAARGLGINRGSRFFSPARPDSEATVRLLSAALAGVPALPGARCRGRGHLFDGAAKGELAETAAARHQQALALCRTCPALASCATWLNHQAPRQRPIGVTAGQVIA